MSLIDKAKGFADKLTQSGEVKKLKITAYSKDDFSEASKKGSYEVPFNPTTLNLKLQIDRAETKAMGQSDGTQNQVAIPSQDFGFEFIVDATGFAGSDGLGNISGSGDSSTALQNQKDVPQQIGNILTLVYKYEGDKHQSNYIEISYGAILVKCVLSSIDISYNLFDKSGKPLRARVNVSFKTTGNKALQDIIANKQSPDLTHVRELKQFDRFLTMSNSIYDDNFLYVQVARANNMNRIRENKTGKKIFFPPLIDKTNSTS